MKWLPKIRFSMRTLFILVTVLCVLLVPLSVKLYQARQQRLVVQWVVANGGSAVYDNQQDLNPMVVSDTPKAIRWLRSVIGNDFFGTVIRVRINNPTVTDISKLTYLRSLTFVSLEDPQNADLSPLGSLKQLNSVYITFSSEKSYTAKNIAELSKLDCSLSVGITGQLIDDLTLIQSLKNIRLLNITDSQVTNLAPLINLDQLENLSIQRTPVKDISALYNLNRLTTLRLRNCQVNDFSQLSYLTQLRALTLDDPKITDLTPLVKLVKLHNLSLNTPMVKDHSPLENLVNLEMLIVSKAEFDKLKKALPRCIVFESSFK
ncbi:MAG: hypothetical protein COA78_24895 [Blastopirellula sp.]|nr:MAG: hypothetical protein COA78_24895 [Blastopirellula sp.]